MDRVAAAVEAARALPVQFTLTARAENYFRGNPDLDDTIRRLQAFEKVGADVLFAPALPSLDAVRSVCAALTKPVSFMATIKGKAFSVAELEAVGVRRISTPRRYTAPPWRGCARRGGKSARPGRSGIWIGFKGLTEGCESSKASAASRRAKAALRSTVHHDSRDAIDQIPSLPTVHCT